MPPTKTLAEPVTTTDARVEPTDAMLSGIQPAAVANLSASWQKRKSAQMQLMLLEAAIDCLTAHGYAGLSTQLVAQTAKVSRGTMAHHFPSKMALVAGVVDYTFYRRMERFLDDFRKSRTLGSEAVAEATDMYWKSVQTREYAAYLELAVAARTDPELNEYFQAAAARYDRLWSEEMVKSFPQWKDRWDELQLASDFAMAAHMGLLMSKGPLGDGARLEQVRKLISHVIRLLHSGGIKYPL